MEGDVPPLSPEQALQLAQNGGALLCRDVPAATAIGIDLRTYAVGERFQGIKMIPPHAVHFLTCGGEVERSGIFLAFPPAGVHVLAWDGATELLSPQPPSDERRRLEEAVRRMEFDSRLGPYPLATEGQWRALSCFVSEAVLSRANVPLGSVVVAGGIDDEGGAPTEALQPFHEGAARVARFVQLDPRRRGGGLTGAELTRYHTDHSEFVAGLLQREYGGGASDEAEGALLGELQLAFILFLQLSSLRALTQWKLLVHTLCKCEALLVSRPGLFMKFLSTLRAQLHFAPHDFFVDSELSEDNFLLGALTNLASATEDQTYGEQEEGAAHARASLIKQHVALQLTEELDRFWKFVHMRFEVDVRQLRCDSALDDDAPVVVEEEIDSSVPM